MKTPFHGALSLLVFLLTIICTYALAPQGLKVRIPRTRWSVFVSFCWIPWFSTALLIIFQAITFKEVGVALTGDGRLRPSSIIVTYISLAYLAISCEITGLYAWLALHAARWTRGRPVLLLGIFFGLSGALTAATGPDISLVALTPMILYTASAADLDPMSMAATHLGAASIWGMLVPVAGPINIIATHAFQLTFIDFLGWMALPTSAAAMVVFLLLCVLLHRHRLATVRQDVATRTLPYPDPGVMLHDQVGAACCSALLVGCLLALAVGPWLRWSGCLVAAVFALMAALFNLAASVGPLRAAIGRRSAYERRRRLQAELALQGLHRVVSDEDLADLLLSAAQDRDASFTRLATATANRIAAGVTPACTSLGSGGGTASAAQRRSVYGSGWSFAGLGSRPPSSSLISGGGSNSSLGYSLPSLASLGSCGGGGAAATAASVSPSPLRQWLSWRWSSFRGFFVAPGASSELVAAAADARADLRILRECVASVPAPAAAAMVAAEPPPPAAIDGSRYSAAAAGGKCGIAESAGAGGRIDLYRSKEPSLPLVSSELHQLLIHGTSASQDTLEWWAAAALAAHELVAARQGKLVVDTPAAVATVQQLALGNCLTGDGDGGAAAGSAGRGAIGGDTGGSLTSASPFANKAAMCFPGWDGHPAAASAVHWNGTTNAGTAYLQQGAVSGSRSDSLDGVSDGAMRMEGSQRLQLSHGNISTVANHRARAGTGAAQVDYVRGDHPRNTCGAYVQGSGSGGAGGDGIGKWKAACGRAEPGCTANASSSSDGGAVAADVTDTGCTGNNGSGRSGSDAPPACCDNPGRKLDHQPLGFAVVQSSPGVLPSSHFPHPQQSPGPQRWGSLTLGGLHGNQDERGSEQGDLAVAAFLPTTGRDVAAATDPDAPLLGHHPMMPPSSSTGVSFEGLFGCWRRRGTVLDSTAAEMVELLPARAAASDDPCHVVQVSPTPVASPTPSAGVGKPIVLPATSLTADSAPYISLPDCCNNGHGPLLSGSTCGPACLAATPTAADFSGLVDTCRLDPVKEPSRCRRSPFPSSVNVVTAGGTVGASNDGGMGHGSDGITGDDRSLDGGCGSGLNRYEGFGASGGSAAAASWSRYKLRRPSAALLMLGSREVGFLGTFAALPWANTVLLLGWFVLVEAMQVHGWIDVLAHFLTTIATVKEPTTSPTAYSAAAGATNPIAADVDATGAGGGSSVGAIAGAVFAIGWLSALLSIGMTGQLAALLLARVVMRPEFLATLQPVAAAASETTLTTGLISLTNNNNTVAAAAATAANSGVSTAAAAAAAVTNHGGSGFHGFGAVQRGAQLALVIAANIAPALSLSGSLTALRWGLGLRSLGVRMQCCKYMVSGLAPAVLVGTVAALLSLWGQCVVWP